MRLKLYYALVFLMILGWTPLIFYIVFCLGVALSNSDVYLAVLALGSFFGFIVTHRMLDLPSMRNFLKLRIQLAISVLFVSLLAYETIDSLAPGYSFIVLSNYYNFYLVLFLACSIFTVWFESKLKQLG